MKKSKTKASPKLEELCPKCSSPDFVVETKSAVERRYCSKCQHVWLPLTTAEIERNGLEKEVIRLRQELKKLKELLSGQSKKIRQEDGDEKDSSKEVFS